MATINLKRGATFALQGTYTPADGALESLEGATIISQVRNGEFVQDLDVAIASDGLSFTVDGGETDDWPLGLAEWDIRIELGGTVIYTDTALVNIDRAVTLPAS